MKFDKFKKIITLSIICSLSLYANSDVFVLDIENQTQGNSYTTSSSSLEEIWDKLNTESIESQIGYNETNQLSANLDFRGLPVTLDFAENSTTLSFSVPSLEIIETFEGNSRDDSIKMLENWFKLHGKETVERIMKKLAEVSPVDPIAGNPNSLMAMSVESDFDDGFMNVASKTKVLSTSVSKQNRIAIGPTYKSLDTDGKKSQSFTLPLSYSFISANDDKERVNLSVPISYTSFEGAKSYTIGVGLSYSMPVNPEWVITPGIKYNMVGSSDLGTLAQLGSLSLASSYSFSFDNSHTLSIGNMIGYYATMKLYDGDYAYNPGITNTVFRNALMYSLPTKMIADNTSLDLYVIDTQYQGTKLFVNNYDEFGFSFGYSKINMNVLSDKSEYAFEKELKIGLSYLTSSKSEGFKINFGFIF